MSDQRLRELERRWFRSGSVDDGVAYLTAGLRTGRVPAERLRLAARVGDPAASAVIGSHDLPGDLDGLIRWARELCVWGPAVNRRVGYAVAALAFPSWEKYCVELVPRWRDPGRRGRPRLDPRPGKLLASLRAWLVCPCAQHQAELRHWRNEAAEVVHLRPKNLRAKPALAAVHALIHAADAEAPEAVVRAFDLLYPEPAGRVVAAARELVVPWALGAADPLREHVTD